MTANILYLGDTALSQQASYLAGIMSYYNMKFDYVGSDEKFCDSLLSKNYDLIIVSDYPACNFSAEQIEAVVGRVKNGMGFLMIGGWESFVGNQGKYNDTLFAEILPVVMAAEDDRVNCSSTFVITRENSHKITDGLSFEEKGTVIGGLNAVKIKEDAVELLSAVEYKISTNDGEAKFEKNRKYPLLVTGNYHLGKVAAFTSDAAPHWVGPFVDWGDKRVAACAAGAEPIEVGNFYAQFFANLIQWVSRKN